VDARALVDAVAGVIADPVRRDAGQCPVGRLDEQFRALVPGRGIERRVAQDVGQERVVDLEQEACVDDTCMAARTGSDGERSPVEQGPGDNCMSPPIG
jgi:hypothetical protein